MRAPRKKKKEIIFAEKNGESGKHMKERNRRRGKTEEEKEFLEKREEEDVGNDCLKNGRTGSMR